MWEIDVIARNHRVWRVSGAPHTSSINIEHSTMANMTANTTSHHLHLVGRPGARRVGSRVESLTPSWGLVFRDRESVGVGQVVAEWLAAWREGVTVTVQSSLGPLSVSARLPDDFSFEPDTNPWSPRVTVVRSEFSWVSDGAVWQRKYLSGPDQSGAVEITNWGDVPITPGLIWQGGSQVSLPGRRPITLPQWNQPVSMVLDHAENCVVVDAESGVRNENLSSWSRPKSLDLSLVIPPGGSVRLGVTGGVSVWWNVGVVSPWR